MIIYFQVTLTCGMYHLLSKKSGYTTLSFLLHSALLLKEISDVDGNLLLLVVLPLSLLALVVSALAFDIFLAEDKNKEQP